MLVLSRKIGERIVVPQCELSVTVLAVEGKTVRLGISAPAQISSIGWKPGTKLDFCPFPEPDRPEKPGKLGNLDFLNTLDFTEVFKSRSSIGEKPGKQGILGL